MVCILNTELKNAYQNFDEMRDILRENFSWI